jgi:hypothetical protein
MVTWAQGYTGDHVALLIHGFLIDHGSDEGGGQRRRWEKRGKKEKDEG